ncbi:UBA-like protein [Artemisia annua]|uniref:UBA-like protein n=1 Tax=Artemisia annua TaxID=35608 RepID=A0A2U1M8C5_ARTAN|nr:UBA-like protein [Artemisia annua]
MSAMVCGKRSYFEELEGSPVTKKHRCSSSSPVKMTSSPLDRLLELFPNLDNQLLEKALEENGNDLDSAIKSLNEVCLAYVNGNSGSAAMSNAATTEEYAENSAAPDNIPRSGAEWVELFVTEMTNATSIDDARSRCMRMLESLEKSITERAGGEAAQSLHKENMVLKERIEALLRENMVSKEQIEALLRENTILKRAVVHQHERQKDYDSITQENQHLKQLVSMHMERVRNLEVEKYALTMHLKEAQEGSSMPGRFHPDVF